MIRHHLVNVFTVLYSQTALSAVIGTELPNAPEGFQWEVTATGLINQGAQNRILLTGDLNYESANANPNGYSPGPRFASVSDFNVTVVPPSFAGLTDGQDFFVLQEIVLIVRSEFSTTDVFINDGPSSVVLSGSESGTFDFSGEVVGVGAYSGSTNPNVSLGGTIQAGDLDARSISLGAADSVSLPSLIGASYEVNGNATASRNLVVDATQTSLAYGQLGTDNAEIVTQIRYLGTRYVLDNAPVDNVPEPSTAFLAGLAFTGLLRRRR